MPDRRDDALTVNQRSKILKQIRPIIGMLFFPGQDVFKDPPRYQEFLLFWYCSQVMKPLLATRPLSLKNT
ncbi:hypothetical protein D3C80_859210 [compost metagenome]